MEQKIESMDEWVSVDDYTVRVEGGLKDALIHDTGVRPPEDVRSVRILVVYANPSNQPLKYRLGQWLLFDAEGFSYEFGTARSVLSRRCAGEIARGGD